MVGIVGTVIAAGLVLLFRDAPAVAAEAAPRLRMRRKRRTAPSPDAQPSNQQCRGVARRPGTSVSNGAGYWAIFRRPIEAPCGSVTMANSPPGKSCGSNTCWAPSSMALSNAALTSGTAK